MADIIDSRDYDQAQLMIDFKFITEHVNDHFRNKFLSPITITLGDEFQCVFENMTNAMSIIFEIEETIIKRRRDFKLRYVIVEGEIATPINNINGYGMMGKGLTEARENLNEIKSNKIRFYTFLNNNERSHVLNAAFLIYQDYLDSWNFEKDYEMVSNFLNTQDYKKVADEMKKTRSQVWKREKSLKIYEYLAIKNVINYIGSIK